MLSIKLRICILIALALVGIAVASPAQETVKVKGFIVARDGAAMNVQGQGVSWTIVLTDDTKVQAIKGTFGLRKDTLGLTDLIPGLPVEVETEHMGRELFARSVKFKADDLKIARQIEAGQVEASQTQASQSEAGSNPNSQQQQDKQGDQAATSKKFGELSEYDVKGEVTIYFAVGSTVVPDDAKQQLKELADNAEKQKGYMIQVAGYADSSGNASYNQELSDRRAETVVDYLQQDCKVPLSRVLSPEGMGESNPAGSNESQQGKKENRRVEVKVLVNRSSQG